MDIFRITAIPAHRDIRFLEFVIEAVNYQQAIEIVHRNMTQLGIAVYSTDCAFGATYNR